ncbi:YciI family protein [Asticcacaulis sp. EMRT-3]|uniref:YciI family protein n=1 Tax=Asticcacaulis sp. EMRT-3 TaxID=3040349 RepID=UPI0024AF4872|nr:YciI family protein [Asticcacaulis sp. EMRT-3]MDI7774098.1 YciI family protein [Asticcacaulis sp. EMRT-3]
MFILSLTYKVPLDVVDQHLEAHVNWLKAGYAAGMFLASGRKVPRSGGMIFAKGTRAEVEACVRLDPFALNGVADYTLIEVNLTMTADGLEGLKD